LKRHCSTRHPPRVRSELSARGLIRVVVSLSDPLYVQFPCCRAHSLRVAHLFRSRHSGGRPHLAPFRCLRRSSARWRPTRV
jgi:hypothetical protein